MRLSFLLTDVLNGPGGAANLLGGTANLSTPSGHIPSPRLAAFPKGLYHSRALRPRMELVVEPPGAMSSSPILLSPHGQKVLTETLAHGGWGTGTVETEEKLACFRCGKRGRGALCRLVGRVSKHLLNSSGRREHSGKGKAKGRRCHQMRFGLGSPRIGAQ